MTIRDRARHAHYEHVRYLLAWQRRPRAPRWSWVDVLGKPGRWAVREPAQTFWFSWSFPVTAGTTPTSCRIYYRLG